MHRSTAIIAAVLALTVAGCGGDDASSADTQAPAPAAADTAAPDGMSLDDAADQYLDMADPANDRRAALQAEHDLNTPAGSILFCGEFAPVVEQLARDLTGAEWPADVQDSIDELANANAVAAGVLYACSTTALNAFDGQPVIDALTDAANAASTVRLALGLPLDR